MDLGEIFESAAFWLLTVVGYGAFILMLVILKGMEQKEIMPLWVKIVVLIVIPIVAALFAAFAEG